ncbi:hypothetical protein [Thermoproteus tenax]|uniref:NurA-like nuclease n=1 Tax=Thermoproteus tenax (strain ATCC 35583 / DSM 2078 / JCM 9277 / NBRC 100435 / Kra 1) TaxID=768679 RepID=G4RMS0_THETK|nr:hypothetical protein [Thermoproteus tenax]CCC80864.1 NurA-like nuclease [Thermoproteus tenax Kra 1]
MNAKKIALILILVLVGSTLGAVVAENNVHLVVVKGGGEVNSSCIGNCLIVEAVRSALKKPPYPIVNKSIFPGTLVTFEMPRGSQYKYVSLVVNKSAIYVYQFNSPRDYRLYAIVDKPQRTVETEIVYKEGNYTYSAELVLALYEVPIPGGDAVPVPHLSYSVPSYTGDRLTTNTTAAGWFYINPSIAVVGLIPDGSAYANPPMALCTSNEEVGGVGTFAAYTYVRARYALLDCPVTTAIFTWPSVGMDANGNVYYPTSIPATKFVTFACGCSG